MFKYIFLSFIIFTIPNTEPMQTKDKQNQAYTLQYKVINSKQFLIPKYNMFDCEKYLLPKLDTAPVHHTFFQPQELQEMYKEMKITPDQINHNLDKTQTNKANTNQKNDKIQQSKNSISVSMDSVDDARSQSISIESIQVPKIKRPVLRETGCTHFIHIPLWDSLKETYNNQIVPRIEEQDRDLLMPLSSMHMTILAFRLKKMQDLPLWSQVLKVAKRPKLSIKGVNIFPVKKNYARVLFLNVKGAQDLVDRVVTKAIQLNLITQSELNHIKFDKATQTYKSQAHISLLRTKADDLYDFTDYLKTLNKIILPRVNTAQIRLSVIGSFNQIDYFNQEIVQL